MYYHEVLESLFFQVLNTPMNKRRAEFRKEPWKDVPFLNGGLFEPHADDHYDADSFLGKSKHLNTLVIKDAWFEELFDVFETYNFTIDENTSIDIELSVEPEMLGRIFENLLAEINPETGESARKSTGSFYTPRPIVEYMVDESIKQYLHTHTGVSVERLAGLLSYSDDKHDLSEKEQKTVMQALGKVKILDPACGSGAFPMGALQKILLILQKLDPEAKESLNNLLKAAPDVTVREMLRRKLQGDKELWNYTRKLSVIRESIYGVDIQPIAVEISKLRFFLSLVVDEKIDETKDNRGIEPLPNLEFKFVCANTLIGLPPVTKQEDLFGESEHVQKLKELRDEYFTSYGDQKKKIEKEIDRLQREMSKDSIKNKEARAIKLALWKPFSDEASSWFDPEWMFGLKEGFDVVIGNPPYDVYQGHRKGEIEELSEIRTYDKAKGGKLNAYKLFLARSIELQKAHSGLICEIFQNSFLADSSSKLIRTYFLENQEIVRIDSFPERDDHKKRIFEAVKMSVCILLSRARRIREYEFELKIWEDRNMSKHTEVLLENSDIKRLDPNNSSIVSISNDEKEILRHIIKISDAKLSDFSKCFEGEINLTFHKKYLYKAKTGNTAMIKGAAVQKWHIKEKMSQGEIMNLDHKSYLKDNQGPKSQHHTQTRIVMQGITGVDEKCRLKMTLIDKGIFCGNSVNYILIENENVSQEFLLAVLNSWLLNWYFKIFSTNSNVNGYEVNQLPIPKKVIANGEIQKPFVNCAHKILSAKKKNPEANTMALEREIDVMVYKLYDLRYDEVKIVDPEFWMSEKEYKGFKVG